MRTLRRRIGDAGRVFFLLTLAGSALSMASCDGGTHDGTPAPTGTATSSPQPSSPAASPSATSGQQNSCVIGQLLITAGANVSGSGHRGVPVVFTNIGQSMCRLSGYPKVTALNANGEPVAQAEQRPSGYLGGLKTGSEPSTVDLHPGRPASAMVEALAFNASGGSACTPYASIQVTPPGQSSAVTLAWNNGGCSQLEVHPVVAGDTGQQQ